MPDDEGLPPAHDLAAELAILDSVIEEAQELRRQITEQMRGARRQDQQDRAGQPSKVPERRKARRKVR